MQKDKNKTKVIFYIDSDGDILAYFPNMPYANDLTINTCYAHIGQHSSCSEEYVETLKKANKKQYSKLETELADLGYNLEII